MLSHLKSLITFYLRREPLDFATRLSVDEARRRLLAVNQSDLLRATERHGQIRLVLRKHARIGGNPIVPILTLTLQPTPGPGSNQTRVTGHIAVDPTVIAIFAMFVFAALFIAAGALQSILHGRPPGPLGVIAPLVLFLFLELPYYAARNDAQLLRETVPTLLL